MQERAKTTTLESRGWNRDILIDRFTVSDQGEDRTQEDFSQ